MATEKMRFVTGRAKVSANGTAVALESTSGDGTKVNSVIITALSGNTSGEHIVVGGSDVVGAVATMQGHPLSPGESIAIEPPHADERGMRGASGSKLIDLADIFVDCITNDDEVTYLAFRS